MEYPPSSELLDDMIHLTPPAATTIAPVPNSYSFQSSSSSSSGEEEEEKEGEEESKKRRRTAYRDGETLADDDKPSNCKILLALLGVLLLVGAIVAVIAYTSWTQRMDKQTVPLRTNTQHTTRSEPLRQEIAWIIAPAVEQVLEHYLLSQPQYYPCLCMHHLDPSWEPDVRSGHFSFELVVRDKLHGTHLVSQYQICAIADPATKSFVHLLVNPTLQGRSNETDYYTEHSISCPAGSQQRHQRFRTIYLEWLDVASSQTMWSRFDGPVAACLQLAMDEMQLGDKHC